MEKVNNRKLLRILSKYEDQYYRAINGNWVKCMTSRELEEIKDTYEKLIGTTYKGSWKPSCSSCLLKFIQVVGRYYYEQTKKVQEKS